MNIGKALQLCFKSIKEAVLALLADNRLDIEVILVEINKLVGVAPLMTDPPPTSSTTL